MADDILAMTTVRNTTHGLWNSAGLEMPIHANFWVVLGRFWPVK